MSDRQEQEELLALLSEIEYREKYSRLDFTFPETGKYARDKYPEAMKLFAAGAKYNERGYVASNRSGKSFSAAFETALHLTGLYPSWWEGKRFEKPILAWVVGVSATAMIDSVQKHLLGPRHEEGTGLIPKKMIEGEPTSKPQVPGARQMFYCKHFDKNGRQDGLSVCTFKTHEQGIDSFMGAAIDWVHFDEEPPRDIYTECLTRTATTQGHVVATFTPLHGVSEVYKMFCPNLKIPENNEASKYRFCIGKKWDGEIPHLSLEEQARMRDSFAPWELTARTEGMPTLGAGAVFPVAEEDIVCDPIDLPLHWPRFAGFDVGWKRTACAWFAYDQTNDVIYLYGEYYRGYAEASIHAEAIKARGKWIPIAIDPASNTPTQKDGDKLFVEYHNMGLNICKADNAVTAGILDMLQRFSTGRLKVFKTCVNFLNEFRMYQYDKDGRIRKQDDHLMDAARYGIRTGFKIKQVIPEEFDDSYYEDSSGKRDPLTGY